MKRREFLRRSATAAAIIGFPMVVSREVLGATHRPGPNDRIQVGFIGLGGRARWILKNEGLPGADLVAAADCNLNRVNEAAQQVAGGDKWRKYQHYRDMLDIEFTIQDQKLYILFRYTLLFQLKIRLRMSFRFR